jgi:hypothetical protein
MEFEFLDNRFGRKRLLGQLYWLQQHRPDSQ